VLEHCPSFRHVAPELGAMAGVLQNLFGVPLNITIKFEGEEDRRKACFHQGGPRGCIYDEGEDLVGTIEINTRMGQRLNHKGISLQFIGQIQRLGGVDETSHDFLNVTKDLVPAGVIVEPMVLDWAINRVDLQHDTFTGKNVCLRYFVRVSINTWVNTFVQERDIICQRVLSEPPVDEGPIDIETGLESLLNVKVECAKSTYHLRDVIVGRITFLTMKVKIQRVELVLSRKEAYVPNDAGRPNIDVVTTFEITDGTPVEGSSIPIRMYLKGLSLTPTMKNVQNQFSVLYVLSFVLVGQDDLRYCQRSEITLYRAKPPVTSTAAGGG